MGNGVDVMGRWGGRSSFKAPLRDMAMDSLTDQEQSRLRVLWREYERLNLSDLPPRKRADKWPQMEELRKLLTKRDQNNDHEIAMDPLTAKGEKIESNMEKTYGPKKGEQVFYASRNKGTIKGVDRIY